MRSKKGMRWEGTVNVPVNDMDTNFESVFRAFIGEAKQAFPELQGEIQAADTIYNADPQKAKLDFAHDTMPFMHVVTSQNSDALLERVADTRLLKGFRLQENAHPANKQKTVEYLTQLMSMAWVTTMVPDDALGGLMTIVEEAAAAQPSEGMDLQQMMGSAEGRKLTGSVAKILGLDIDMESAEAKEAMRQVQALLF